MLRVPVMHDEDDGKWMIDQTLIDKRMPPYAVVNSVLYYRAMQLSVDSGDDDAHALLVVRNTDGSGSFSVNDHSPLENRPCNTWQYQLARVVYLRLRPGECFSF